MYPMGWKSRIIVLFNKPINYVICCFQQREQLVKLKEDLNDEISFHEEQIKRHQEAIQRNKNRVKGLDQPKN